MSYEKQTWNKYDELKTEEENIENGAVVTDNRMNHIEEGIYSHTIDISNPHKVTAAQVGLGNIQNFGLATEDEAKQGDSNAKYMTPSLTQAVLSANINSIAYANSADGTDGFTTVYPNLNLLTGTSTKVVQATSWNMEVADIKYDKSLGGDLCASVMFNNADHASDLLRGSSTIMIQTFDKSGKSLATVYGNNVASDANSLSQCHVSIDDNTASVKVVIFTNNMIQNAFYSRLKIEPGSTATPYMQSASEVTTADWPKYVGFSNTVKTNKSASDYTWFPVKDSELTNKVESHINNKANPHAVTASQVGAYSKQEIDTKLSKAVMADDSGKVILKDFEVTTISETVNIGNGLSLNFQRKGEFVLVRFSGSLTAINSGTYFSTAVPDQWRPDGIKELIGHFASGTLAFHVDLETDGRVKWWGDSGATGAPRGTAMYFLK
ncbi:hypothetical protein FEZ44_13770 [Lactococcus cremoris]|uniref:hypothetical protein n=1 Tax=Lactococcus lactis subsp. cremoris TaxID=1359 RepID=UPI0011090622|nr:hypothetical protein [Lactococcus cremoris]TLQ06919.1 hypothetical protein FEZ44_13770 [Lactococcus cremoris]